MIIENSNYRTCISYQGTNMALNERHCYYKEFCCCHIVVIIVVYFCLVWGCSRQQQGLTSEWGNMSLGHQIYGLIFAASILVA